MDNAQKQNNLINIPSLQTFKTRYLPNSFTLIFDYDFYLLQIKLLGYTALQKVKNTFLFLVGGLYQINECLKQKLCILIISVFYVVC